MSWEGEPGVTGPPGNMRVGDIWAHHPQHGTARWDGSAWQPLRFISSDRLDRALAEIPAEYRDKVIEALEG